MDLKPELLRGIYAYGYAARPGQVLTTGLSGQAQSSSAQSCRPGRHCTGTVGDREDSDILDLSAAEDRHRGPAVPGADSCADTGACTADPEGCYCNRGLYACRVPCVHWRHKHTGRHADSAGRGACGGGDAGTGPRHDPAAGAEDGGHPDLCDGRGGRDALAAAAVDTGGAFVGNDAAGCAGGDDEVYAGPDPDPGEEGRADAGGDQAVLHSGGAGGLEAGHAV
ncbi:hypothetical protein PMAC_002432 [Pneumocystis sp. 'macacae']|nr:hypothetical protein PMAC_002432 [Pneumocystis sp. 'macacae']